MRHSSIKAEEADAVVGDLVQPVERRTVPFGKLPGNPNDGDSLQTGGISQELPEMQMIGALKLVLDKHPLIGTDVLAQDVSTKRTDQLFLCFKFKLLDTQRGGQHFKIFGLC
jgi:hypothetical protein